MGFESRRKPVDNLQNLQNLRTFIHPRKSSSSKIRSSREVTNRGTPAITPDHSRSTPEEHKRKRKRRRKKTRILVPEKPPNEKKKKKKKKKK